MKISINEGGKSLLLEEVFNGVVLKSCSGEELGICMRDTGFEIMYADYFIEAKENQIIIHNSILRRKSDE